GREGKGRDLLIRRLPCPFRFRAGCSLYLLTAPRRFLLALRFSFPLTKPLSHKRPSSTASLSLLIHSFLFTPVSVLNRDIHCDPIVAVNHFCPFIDRVDFRLCTRAAFYLLQIDRGVKDL